MSVVGIDFGNESCYIAVAKAGGIETIANDYSLRATPSCVAFQERNRIAGVAAANQRVTNMKNTIVNFKRLLGRKYNDPVVQEEMKTLPYCVVPQDDGNIGVKVRYMNEEQVFSPQQITGMLLTQLKATAEIALKTAVKDCVISVPWFFTHAERMALLDAAHIAGLNVLRLFNETTSTALAYGFFKNDLPPMEEKPRNVVFVDCGHASLQVSVAAFNNGKVQMLAAAADPNLGGRDFDRVLADHFAKEFVTKYKVDAMKNPRAYLRLTTEVEKIKKQMSANSTKLPLNIECFMEDRDVASSMQRSTFEEMCEGLFTRVRATLVKCLQDCKLSLDDIYAVEVVGGSTRIPAIKNLIEEVFKKHPSTTLNQDEAVARGCALQCATLAPAMRVKDFAILDIQNYPVSIRCSGGPIDIIEIFPANYPVPNSRKTTLKRTEPFQVDAYYSGPTPYPDPAIATFNITGIKPGMEKVKIKVRVNKHGLLVLNEAVGLEPITAAEQEKIEKEEKMETEQAAENGGDAGGKDVTEEAPETAEEKKEKKKFRSVDLAVDTRSHGLSEAALLSCLEAEGQMAGNDKMEKERVDAKNSLEEYVYDLRGKLQEDGQLSRYVPPTELTVLCTLLDDVENWLYNEGEDCIRKIYADRLDELRNLGEPIKNRKVEADVRPAVLEDLARSIQQSHKIIDEYRNNDDKYAHIPEDEIKKAEVETVNVEKWLEEQRALLHRIQLHDNPPVTVAQIRQHKQSFENIVAPIYNKPKPKVEAPPAADAPQANGESGNSSKPEEKMETDG